MQDKRLTLLHVYSPLAQKSTVGIGRVTFPSDTFAMDLILNGKECVQIKLKRSMSIGLRY